MRTILHILTRPADELTRELIAKQRQIAEAKIEVVELASGSDDYDALVDKIFSADSIEVS
jgi:hypothetical protein